MVDVKLDFKYRAETESEFQTQNFSSSASARNR